MVDKIRKIRTADIVAKVVDILTPLQSDDRQRVIRASLTLLEEDMPDSSSGRSKNGGDSGTASLSPRARGWATQNGLSIDDLQQVFHMENGTVEIITPELPGKSNKEKTYNAYILAGISRLLASDRPNFDDKSARAVCESSGCFDVNNHATYLKNKGNEFTGSKSTGWTLTAPGLKRGAALVRELTQNTK